MKQRCQLDGSRRRRFVRVGAARTICDKRQRGANELSTSRRTWWKRRGGTRGTAIAGGDARCCCEQINFSHGEIKILSDTGEYKTETLLRGGRTCLFTEITSGFNDRLSSSSLRPSIPPRALLSSFSSFFRHPHDGFVPWFATLRRWFHPDPTSIFSLLRFSTTDQQRIRRMDRSCVC